MTRFLVAAALPFVVAALPFAAHAEPDAQSIAWNEPAKPFRIAGNLYFVGTKRMGAYLIATPKGHILIDGILPETAPQIAGNIRKLGFRLRDVRYLLNNHAHWDHAGGLAALKRMTGATMVASRADAPTLESGRAQDRDDLPSYDPVKVDRVIDDGVVVALGGTRLVAHMTPGHTPGCTSWSFDVRDVRVMATRPIHVFIACSLTPAGAKLIDNPRQPQIAADFRSTFAKLDAISADIFLTYHGEYFDLERKRDAVARDPRAFVDAAEMPRRIATARAGFEKELARQQAAASPGAAPAAQ